MGTWTLWIAFHAGIALFLLLNMILFHRRAHEISLREAALESAIWVFLSAGFGLWIFFSHGHGPGLEFFTGYVIEKSLSVDNVFVFLLIFQFFRVDPRYQHRLLFWGVLGALALRGAMIAVGVVLIHRFDWVLYLFGAFLLFAGFKLFGADHSVHPENNFLVRWMQKTLPMSNTASGPQLFLRENGRWLATPLFLVVVVIETTDLLFAVDSIPAVFGVTRDPFLVYTSNVCAILGLRALYFLVAGILPYFQYLDEGLAVVLMFIGGKMLADPWLHISTGISLAIVGGVISAAMAISVWAANANRATPKVNVLQMLLVPDNLPVAVHIRKISEGTHEERASSAALLYLLGLQRAGGFFSKIQSAFEFRALQVFDGSLSNTNPSDGAKITVGIAVQPETFKKIRAANGSPPLANAPADQDVVEIELEFQERAKPHFRLDILTTKAPNGGGAIARFLEKFGEGIQQVEIDVTDVDRSTEILLEKFKLEPIFPETRPGANGTRVNFFLVPGSDGRKVLVELVEQPKTVS
jgi:tellurite resistance protein TerC